MHARKPDLERALGSLGVVASDELSLRETLQSALGEVIGLLDQYFSYRDPIAILSEIARRVELDGQDALVELRSKFGGMGSLNNFYLHGNPSGTLSASERAEINALYQGSAGRTS